MSNYIQDLGYHQDLGLDFGAVKTFGKTLGKTAFGVVKTYGEQAGQKEAYKQMALAQQQAAAAQAQKKGLPGWAIPVGIGAAALVLIMVLKK